jgi:hypothetical protein
MQGQLTFQDDVVIIDYNNNDDANDNKYINK